MLDGGPGKAAGKDDRGRDGCEALQDARGLTNLTLKQLISRDTGEIDFTAVTPVPSGTRGIHDGSGSRPEAARRDDRLGRRDLHPGEIEEGENHLVGKRGAVARVIH